MITSKYNQLAQIPSDINEHMPILRSYAQECSHVTELGVRAVVSTWAWLDAKVPTIRCYDLFDPPVENLLEAYLFAQENNLDFSFTRADVLQTTLEPTELLFIDTWHVYRQLKQELYLHGLVASKYMIFHDTTTYGRVGEDGSRLGLQDAIDEWLFYNRSWRLKEVFTNNNGLTVLERL